MEAYRLDNTGYPASEANSPIAPHYLYSMVDRRLLTTPVSYLDVYPQDVFWSTTTTSILYRLDAVAYVPSTIAPYYYRSYNVYPKTSWMTWSIGPDRLSNTSGYCPLPKIIENEAAPAGGYWLLAQSPAILAESNYGRLGSYNPMNGIRYDPANGEISDGDIYRFGSEALWREN